MISEDIECKKKELEDIKSIILDSKSLLEELDKKISDLTDVRKELRDKIISLMYKGYELRKDIYTSKDDGKYKNSIPFRLKGSLFPFIYNFLDDNF